MPYLNQKIIKKIVKVPTGIQLFFLQTTKEGKQLFSNGFYAINFGIGILPPELSVLWPRPGKTIRWDKAGFSDSTIDILDVVSKTVGVEIKPTQWIYLNYGYEKRLLARGDEKLFVDSSYWNTLTSLFVGDYTFDQEDLDKPIVCRDNDKSWLFILMPWKTTETIDFPF